MNSTNARAYCCVMITFCALCVPWGCRCSCPARRAQTSVREAKGSGKDEFTMTFDIHRVNFLCICLDWPTSCLQGLQASDAPQTRTNEERVCISQWARNGEGKRKTTFRETQFPTTPQGNVKNRRQPANASRRRCTANVEHRQ